MFESITTAPPDPILGLSEAFAADPRAGKVNLGIGVYKDAAGKTPVLPSVKEAERRILDAEATKGYKPMTGDPQYGKIVRELILGAGHPVLAAHRADTAHTPGGTGALRVAGDYLAKVQGVKTIHLTDPTWANHDGIFAAAGLEVKTYPYFDKAANSLAFDAMLAALKAIPAGDAVLLHGACHNPTGVDPTAEQWRQIAEVLASSGVLPLIDFAYQGFGDGLEEDAVGVRTVAAAVDELLICSSFSKNFGLYNERTGAMTVIAKTPEALAAVISHVKLTIRTNYSNPPAHGGEIVMQVLSDAALTAQWQQEVAEMRNRINTLRRTFVDTMKAKAPQRDFSFIADQRGMFSFSGLTKDQVARLKEEHAIYIVGSGRINVAGMNERLMDALCTAITSVL